MAELDLLKDYPALVLFALAIGGALYFQAKAALANSQTALESAKAQHRQTDAIEGLTKAINRHIEKEVMNNAEMVVVVKEIKELTRATSEAVDKHHVWAEKLLTVKPV